MCYYNVSLKTKKNYSTPSFARVTYSRPHPYSCALRTTKCHLQCERNLPRARVE